MLLLSGGESCGISVDGIPTAAALRFAPAFGILEIPCRAGSARRRCPTGWAPSLDGCEASEAWLRQHDFATFRGRTERDIWERSPLALVGY